MHRLGLYFLSASLFIVCGLGESAQSQTSQTRTIPACSDSTSPYRARVLVVLDYAGTNYREMWSAINLASEHAGICILSREVSSPSDTSLYGRLRINALPGGGYEVATALDGPRAVPTSCTSRRAAIVTGDVPIIWGVILSGVVRRFVDCLAATRARGPQPA